MCRQHGNNYFNSQTLKFQTFCPCNVFLYFSFWLSRSPWNPTFYQAITQSLKLSFSSLYCTLSQNLYPCNFLGLFFILFNLSRWQRQLTHFMHREVREAMLSAFFLHNTEDAAVLLQQLLIVSPPPQFWSIQQIWEKHGSLQIIGSALSNMKITKCSLKSDWRPCCFQLASLSRDSKDKKICSHP